MKNREVLKELERMYREDGILGIEADIGDILDYLGIIGVKGASDLYIDLLVSE